MQLNSLPVGIVFWATMTFAKKFETISIILLCTRVLTGIQDRYFCYILHHLMALGLNI